LKGHGVRGEGIVCCALTVALRIISDPEKESVIISKIANCLEKITHTPIIKVKPGRPYDACIIAALWEYYWLFVGDQIFTASTPVQLSRTEEV
jgi:hypothetical protein